MEGKWDDASNTVALQEAAEEVFRKAYHQDQPDVDPNEDVIHSWSSLLDGTTNDSNIKKYVIGVDTSNPFEGKEPSDTKHRSIRFSFEGDIVHITSRGKNGGLLKKDNVAVFDTTVSIADHNTFLVPEYDTRNVHVEVEGEIGADVTLATEANNVLITNDIYYTGMDQQIPLEIYENETINITPTKWTINSGNDQEETDRATLQALTDYVHDPSNGITQKFGLMAGIGKVDGEYNTAHIMTSYQLATGDFYSSSPGFVDRTDNGKSRSFLNDAALIMGAYFAPGGMFGAQYHQNNDLISDEYWDVNHNNGKNYSDNNTFWGGDRDLSTGRVKNYDGKCAYIAVIGSVGMKSRGNLTGTAGTGTQAGIFTFFANDERFSTDGWSPLGFKPAVGKIDGESVNLITEGVQWSLDWE